MFLDFVRILRNCQCIWEYFRTHKKFDFHMNGLLLTNSADDMQKYHIHHLHVSITHTLKSIDKNQTFYRLKGTMKLTCVYIRHYTPHINESHTCQSIKKHSPFIRITTPVTTATTATTTLLLLLQTTNHHSNQ